MIIRHFDLVRIAILPLKADAPLIVNSNTILSLAVAMQFFQPIAGGHPDILKRLRSVQNQQLPEGSAAQLMGESFDWFTKEDSFRLSVTEASDHEVVS